jgi:hypothetical protein
MVRITALIFDCPAFRTGSEFFSSDRLYCLNPAWQSSQELFPVVAERRITPPNETGHLFPVTITFDL